jgi:hypothetical protein
MVTINFTGVVEVLRFSQVFLLIMLGKRKKKIANSNQEKETCFLFSV